MIANFITAALAVVGVSLFIYLGAILLALISYAVDKTLTAIEKSAKRFDRYMRGKL